MTRAELNKETWPFIEKKGIKKNIQATIGNELTQIYYVQGFRKLYITALEDKRHYLTNNRDKSM